MEAKKVRASPDGARVVVEDLPEAFSRRYYTNWVLSGKTVVSFQFPLTAEAPDWKTLDPLLQDMIMDIFAIMGVKRITVTPYDMVITISPAVRSWEMIEAIVLNGLRRTCAHVYTSAPFEDTTEVDFAKVWCTMQSGPPAQECKSIPAPAHTPFEVFLLRKDGKHEPYRAEQPVLLLSLLPENERIVR